jgi:hypothetical protein
MSRSAKMRDYTRVPVGKIGFSPNLREGNTMPVYVFLDAANSLNARTALVWFLIAQTIHIKTGVSCDTISGYQDLPLCSPKSLWEARTRSTWATEYEVYQSMSRNGLDVFGDLIDACKQGDTGSARRGLDTWNANTDNLGMILSLSATMMARN